VSTANVEHFPESTMWVLGVSMFLDFSEILDNSGTDATRAKRELKDGEVPLRVVSASKT
jgi:hypothetical protein